MNKFSILRQRQKFTQKVLAEKMNISHSQICQYESGVRKPQINMVPKLAKVLNCTIEQIVLCFCDE